MKGAEYYFSITVNSEVYRYESIEMLARIDFAMGKIADAREKIDKLDMNSDSIKRLLARIEAVEYNYAKSIEILNSTYCNNLKANFDLASVKMHLRSFDESRKMLESCIHYKNVGILARFYLVFISILEGNYEKAYEELRNIDKKNLGRDLLTYYNRANMVIGHKLKKDLRGFQCDEKTLYFRDILLDKDDSVLLSHVIQHKLDGEMIFFNDFNLRKLLEELREKMKNVNFNIYGMSANYGIMLDYPVSFYNGKEINGVTVSTILGTDKIMTFYPTQFSSEFDVEGYSKNPELKKRLNR